MRDFGVVIGCIIGVWLIISLVSMFNSTSQQSAGAIETAHLRAEASAARAEAQKLKTQLKQANDANRALSKRVAELEKMVAAKAETILPVK